MCGVPGTRPTILIASPFPSRDQEHLGAIIAEAQRIVAAAL